MFAKQTAMAASLLVLLGGLATADPGGDGRGYFQIGAGYSTDEGFLATAAVDQPDLFHTGNELGLFARMSERHQRFDALFRDPHVLGGTLTLDLYNDVKQMPGFTRQDTGLSMRQSRALSEHVTAWVGYRIASVSTDGATLGKGAPVDSAAGTVSAFSVGMAYTTQRLQLGAWAEDADRMFGSTHGFGRVGGWAMLRQPVGPFVLHAGGNVTAVTPNAPLSEWLMLDGGADVRGYVPGALGLATWKAVGHASIELPISHEVSLEGFGDAAQLGQMHALSAGYGLVWKSPIGPIHADVAYPLDGPPQFFISLGAL
ncbi:MAG: BamA/TamA family outer membrane protein [Deltaproteobacteria bacterium]|nr:BamA/TamA family outer membrane protein [Deltaproteobacteria bacterium]